VNDASNTFPCPQCGTKLKVLDSRPGLFWGGHSIRRRRACPKCDYRHSTYEVSLDSLNNFAERLHDLGNALVETSDGKKSRFREAKHTFSICKSDGIRDVDGQ